jgi:hypothetical protein
VFEEFKQQLKQPTTPDLFENYYHSPELELLMQCRTGRIKKNTFIQDIGAKRYYRSYRKATDFRHRRSDR